MYKQSTAAFIAVHFKYVLGYFFVVGQVGRGRGRVVGGGRDVATIIEIDHPGC